MFTQKTLPRMEEKQSRTYPQPPLLVFTWEEKHVIYVKTKLELLL
jgi:hypothetical protein